MDNEKVYRLKIEGADSVNDLKKAIDQLNEKLQTLNESSKEYNDTLRQLADVQKQLNDTIGTARDTLEDFGNTGNNVVDSFLTGFVEGLVEAASATTDVNTSTIELDDSLTKEATSLKELKEQINGLKDRLVQLNVNSKEYKETVEILVEKNQKLQSILSTTKREVNSVAGSYNALSQEMAALRKRWKETSDEAERSQIGQRIAEINTELKKMDASIGNYQRNVGNYAGAIREAFTDPRKEIRALRLELAQLEEGTEEYNNTLARLADVTAQQRKLNEQLRFTSSDLGDVLGNLAGVASSVAGGFSALNALMGLMGNQSGDLQKAMLKTQQFMALIQGLSQLENLKDKIKGLIDGIKGFTSRFGVVNASTKEFTENAKAASSEAERAAGSMDSQAGAAEKLSTAQERLSESERNSMSIIQQEINDRRAKIAVLQEEYDALLKMSESRKWNDFSDSAKNEAARREEILDEIEALQNEINMRESAVSSIESESNARDKNVSEIEKETIAIDEEIKRLRESTEEERVQISVLEDAIEFNKEMVESLEEHKRAGEELSEEEESQIEQGNELIETANSEMQTRKESLALEEQQIAKLQQEKAIKEQYLATQKNLTTQLQGYRKTQVLSIAQTKLQIVESKQLYKAQMAEIAGQKGLAMAYNTTAVAARVASVAIKGVKAALISSGIGALLVLAGSAISNLIESVGNLFSGSRKLNAELDIMGTKTKELKDNLAEIKQIADGFGFSQFKKASLELKEMSKVVKSLGETYHYAIEQGKEDTDELRDAWYEAQDSMNEALLDGSIMIDKLIADVEKADRQKGMTQLEKDLEETNKKFEDAIELVKTFGEEGVWSAERVEAKINSLNNALAKQTQMLIENANSATTSTTHTEKSEYEKQKEEADKLYKELVEANKREEQKLKEKYEKEKKLLEKFHKDTTLLTKKYYEDLDKLLTERQKIEYDKWVAHLNSMLGLQRQNSIEYYEMQIENMKKIFSADFGDNENTPFNQMFNIQILDEFGSKAIQITDDIRESMKMMGLDPHNIDDIQTMIDKWETDKTAIEDAEKALVKFKSELKFNEFTQEGDALEGYMEAMLNNIDFMSEKIQSQSLWKGFYSGLSPEQEKADFEARYKVIEEELNKELELWRTAMNDETLSAEDRNKAIQKYNQTMAKVNSYAVQKEIDANNLLIKSFQRVTDAISSMSTNLANILGSVSDMIMDTAQAELDAGKIKEEEYEKQFNRAKGIQIAQATINTIAGAVGAFMGITRDTGGWGIAAAAIEAAAVLAAGFAQIAQIRNTKVDSNGGGGGESSGGDSSVFQLPSVMVPEPQRVQNTTNQSDIDALANALGDKRVVLVESDVTLAQNRTQKVSVETTF